MTIQVLPPQVANQIAAGEVVERPSAVVKELMENCLDAGATRILVEIAGGGAKKILIRDNGCGIPRDELALALKRHATSKLSSIQDLNRLTSMGFRGEALASIAAVTRLTLTSKPASQDMAYAVEVEGICQEPKISPASHPDGTTIEALDLFFNTPARRRFLKSEKTEFLQIEEIFKRIAVSRPDVAFVLKNNGKVVHDLKAVSPQNEIRRLESLLGKSTAADLTFFEWSDASLSIRGYVSVKAQGKPVQYFFVNGRIVRDKVIIHAVREAYETVFGVRGDVSYVCFLDMPPEDVDINVHPQKSEVRFQESRRVHDFIQTSVMNVFRNAQMVLPETMNETALSQQNHHYAGVKPLGFDEARVSDFWSARSVTPVNEPDTSEKDSVTVLGKKDFSELLTALDGGEKPEAADLHDAGEKVREGSSVAKTEDKPSVAEKADVNYNRLFNCSRGSNASSSRSSSFANNSGRVKWSGEAMSKMFGTAASPKQGTESFSSPVGLGAVSQPHVSERTEADSAVMPSAEADNYAAPVINWHEPWMIGGISEYSLYRTVLITDDGECAVISNGTSLKLVSLKKLAGALFADSFAENRAELLQSVNLLVPFDFRDGTVSDSVLMLLRELGFVLRTQTSGFTVLAVPAVVRDMNLAGIIRDLIGMTDENTGVRDALRILSDIVFRARVPATFSTKMTARMVQSITYEKYFEERLDTGYVNVDLSEYISCLLKK